MDMVHYASIRRIPRTKASKWKLTKRAERLGGEASKVDIEEYAGAVGIRSCGDVAMDAAGAGKGGVVGDALWVVLGNGSIPKFACCARYWESVVGG